MVSPLWQDRYPEQAERLFFIVSYNGAVSPREKSDLGRICGYTHLVVEVLLAASERVTRQMTAVKLLSCSSTSAGKESTSLLAAHCAEGKMRKFKTAERPVPDAGVNSTCDGITP